MATMNIRQRKGDWGGQWRENGTRRNDIRIAQYKHHHVTIKHRDSQLAFASPSSNNSPPNKPQSKRHKVDRGRRWVGSGDGTARQDWYDDGREDSARDRAPEASRRPVAVHNQSRSVDVQSAGIGRGHDIRSLASAE